MAGFRTKRGSRLGDAVRFCLQCGAPVASAPSPAPGPASEAPGGVRGGDPPPSAGRVKWGTTVLRIIVGLLAFSVLVMLLSIASRVYFDYRAPKKSIELPQAHHYDMTQGAPSVGAVSARNVCSLVTNTEVGEALGTTVSAANIGTSSCRYTSSVGNSLAVEVTWQGGPLALKLAAMALKGATGRAGVFWRIAGIGDEAYAGGPMGSTTLIFRKGDVMVNLGLRMPGNNVEAARTIAQKIAARL